MLHLVLERAAIKGDKFEKGAHILLAQILLEAGKAEEALTTIQESLKVFECVPLMVYLADAHKKMGNIATAKTVLEKASEYLKKDDASFQDHLFVANAYYFIGDYDNAIPIYEKLIIDRQNDDVMQRLLHSYYKVDRHKDALGICERAKSSATYPRFVAEVESDIYEGIGDLVNAQKSLELYLKQQPKDGHMIVRLARLYGRAEQFEKIDPLIKALEGADELNLEDSFMFAFLLNERGRPHQALDVAYEARRTYGKKPEAHLKYIAFFLQVDRTTIERPKKVEVDTAVVITNGIGKERTFIIEKSEREGSDLREISLDDERAKQMKNKSVGEEFPITTNVMGDETAKVESIMSKYVFAYQESGEIYAQMQPNDPSFSTIPVTKGEEKKVIEKIMENARLMQERGEKLEELYQDKKMPIGMFADALHRSVIEVWDGLIANPNAKVVCCIGNNEELAAGAECFALYAGKASVPVIDASAILTIHKIGAQEYAEKIFPRFGISQSTKELFLEKLKTLETLPSAGVITASGYIEVTPEQIAAEKAQLVSILGWIDKFCDVLPVKAALELGKERKEHLEEVLGETFLDSLLLASEEGRCLYSDDLLVKVVAQKEFKVRSFWTQLMLMRAEKLKLIEKEDYARISLELLKFGFDYTSVNGDVLMMAVREAKWQPNDLYTQILNILKTAEESSVIRMAADFFFSLMHQPVLAPLGREALIIPFMNAVSENKNLEAFFKKLIPVLNKKFTLSPLTLDELLRILIQWREMQMR